MKNKYKVEIIIPIIESHKKGDINYMKKKDAEKYEKEGLVKILDKKEKGSHTLPKEKINIKDERVYKIFFNRFSFFQIKEDKDNLFYIRDNVLKTFYIKKSSGFEEQIYLLLINYSNQNNIFLNDFISYLANSCYSQKKQDRKILLDYIYRNNLINLVENIKFKPVEQDIIIEDGKQYLNNYKPTKYLSQEFNNGCKDQNSFPNIKELLYNLSGNDLNTYNYLLKVLSYSITNPEVKRQGYLLFQGDGGSGKGTFFDLIMQPIFKNYFYVGGEEEIITNKFNTLIAEKLWVFIEEKEKTKNNLKESIASKLKMLTGNSKTKKEGKGIDSVEIDDYKQYGLTTNKMNPGLDLQPGDRRCSVIGYSETLGGSLENAPKFRAKYEIEIPKELDNFVSYLKNMEFDYITIFNILDNEPRRDLIKLDYSNTAKFIYWFKNQFNNLSLNDINEELTKKELFDIIEYKSFDKGDYIQTSTIYKCFSNYCIDKKMNVTSSNNFFAEFYQITKISKSIQPGKQTGEDKDRRTYINYNEFKRYFGIIEQIDLKQNKEELIKVVEVLEEDII